MNISASALTHSKPLPPIPRDPYSRAEMVREANERIFRAECQSSFSVFASQVRPDIIIGRHHRLMARKFEAIERGEIRRLMIFMPPGHTKSLFGSIILPAWFIGRHPEKRILHVSHTAELVQGFSREVRDIVQTDEYQQVFPNVQLRADSKAVGRWHTTKGGVYTAAGVGGAIAGKRGEIGIIDDPISEQDAYSETAHRRFQDWYPAGFRTRLMPGAPIIWIQTRWTYNDPAGWLLGQARDDPKREQWEVIELPAILDEAAAAMLGDGAQAGEALFPELWPLSEMQQLRDELPEDKWESLYQQKPQPEEGGILKKKYWRIWPDDKKLPEAEHVFCSWDTAYSERDMKDASYSARTVWSVFWDEAENRFALMLSGGWWDRVSYPELRKRAQDDAFELKPDAHLIEKKASGQSLIQDLRRAGKGQRSVRVRTYTPDRDKISRAHAATSALAAGLVYVPNRKWAHQIIDQCSRFPYGEPPSADITDTVSQAVVYLNRRWWVTHPDDVEDEAPTVPDWYEDEDQPDKLRHGVYG